MKVYDVLSAEYGPWFDEVRDYVRVRCRTRRRARALAVRYWRRMNKKPGHWCVYHSVTFSYNPFTGMRIDEVDIEAERTGADDYHQEDGSPR